MRAVSGLCLGLFALILAACEPVATGPGPAGPAPTAPVPRMPPGDAGDVVPRATAQVAARNFVDVIDRVEPVAESFCRSQTTGMNCDFAIVVDDRQGLAPNAFQTVDSSGRPVVGFTLSLIAEARNQDELAFILGHEAGHHIAGHLSRSRDAAVTGAILGGILASVGGGDAAAVRSGQQFGAQLGARRYSKDFELEADSLGTIIAARAGYDPLRGAEFFARSPDPGNEFLGTHPPNAERIATVRRTAAGL
ncbi:peptidase M48 [Mesobaculum littorinae]|uniref:Peptidase M48 n=1 Tax=Mesobaculum littorinae TaxID=2486419 RepID=A0A438AKM2_9RHOB|nr:M48 family metallopeptidase [Mesobaculum littorinae]RVV99165.1 peptidase M48 [Mesobaculum littorinae]